MNRLSFWLTTSAVFIAFTGCAGQSTQEDTIRPLNVRAELANERNAAVPTARQEIAMPVESPSALTDDLLNLTSAPEATSRIDIEATDRPAKQFFAELGRSQNINMLVDPAVSDNITLSLRNVTMPQVLAALRDTYGFDFEQTNYGYRVSPNQLGTRIYRINYLNIERAGVSRTQIGGDDTNTVTTSFAANSGGGDINFWGGIRRSILGFIANTDGMADPVVINEQTGLVVVNATTKEHAAIARFLIDAELILQKQVIIEAKIVEVTLADEFRSGINWNFFNDNFGTAATSAGVGLAGNNVQGPTDLGGVFNLNLSLDNFASMLQLLDYQGDVQVLSSPRVSTVNNQKAVIKVGTDEYFATVTSVTTENTDGDSTVSPSVELTQFFSGIALDVTPQISGDNTVTLHVRPTVTEVTEQTKNIDINGETFSLPLAYSNIRESDSIIRAQNGQIIVIGGLLQQSQDNGSSGIPWFGRLPVVSLFFSQQRELQRKSELVILLKPTIYDEYTSMTDLDQVMERID